MLLAHGSLQAIIEKSLRTPGGKLFSAEVTQVLNEGCASGGEDREWSCAEDVPRGGGAVEEQAFEPSGNAVKETIALAADLKTVDGAAWAVFRLQEMLEQAGDREGLGDGQVRQQVFGLERPSSLAR